MLRKLVIFMVIAALAALLWIATLTYEDRYLENVAYSFIALAVIYFVFKVLLEELATRRISDPRSRYSFRRVVSILNVAAFVVAGLAVWVENTQSLVVSYGLIAAGVAVALQDFFKNIVGGITLFLTGLYRVGDRVEINGKHGDVIDVGLQYTTLLEIQEWISGDQPTGRLVTSPNGAILSRAVHNYTKDHSFIWDEISLPITHDSDWKEASAMALDIAERETKELTEKARISLINLSDKYFLPARAEVPALYLTMTDNWIEMNIRYVTDVRQRRSTKDRLSRLLLEEIQRAEHIRIASETMDLTIEDRRKRDLG